MCLRRHVGAAFRCICLKGGVCPVVGIYFYGLVGHRLDEQGEVGETVFVDDQCVERVAYTYAARLGVEYDVASHGEVAILVEVSADYSGPGLNDRYAGVVADEINQPLASAWDAHVHISDSIEHSRCGFVCGRKQGYDIFVDAFIAQHSPYQRHDSLVGVFGIAAPFEDTCVCGLEAEREHIESDIGAGFVYYADYAERYADTPQTQSVGAFALIDYFTYGQGSDATWRMSDAMPARRSGVSCSLS